MGTADAIRAGAAYVEAYLEQARLNRDLAVAEAKMRTWSQSIANLGAGAFGGDLPGPISAILRFASSPAGIVTGLGVAAKGWASFGDEIGKAAKRTGIAADALSALKYAAGHSDVTFEALQAGLGKMARTLSDALDGEKTATDALGRLGVSALALQGIGPEKQFARIADAVMRIADPTARAAAVMEVFGRGGLSLMPLLREGSNGISALTDRARELGLVIGDDVAESAEQFSDLVSDMLAVAMSGVRAIGAAMIPQFREIVQWIISSTSSARDWISSHSYLVEVVFKASAAIVGFGAAAMAMSKMASVASSAISAMGTLLTPGGLFIAGLAAAAFAAYKLYDAITGLSEAEERLAEVQEKLAGHKAIRSAIQSAIDSGDKDRVDKEIALLQKRIDSQKQVVDKDKAKLRSKTSSGEIDPKLVASIGVGIEELAYLEQVLKTTREQRDKAVAAGKLTTGKQRNQAAADKGNDGLRREIENLKADAIADSQKRDTAKINLEYERKLKEAGVDPLLVEQARQQALANMRAKYAQQAVAEEDRKAKQIADANRREAEEAERLQIEKGLAGKTESEKELARLKHKQDLERRAARDTGVDMDILGRKQELEQEVLKLQQAERAASEALGLQTPKVESSVVGTFRSEAISGIGVGSGVWDKMDDKLAAIKDNIQKLVSTVQAGGEWA